MGIKQYIGARYVPLMDGAYDPNKEYEPLTTVSYGQATYTSRKKVPAGVLPTDSEYWMYIPSGSQSVAELEVWKTQTVDPFMQQTSSDINTLEGNVSSVETDLNTLSGRVDAAESDIDGLQTTTANLQTQIDNLDLVRDRKFVFIGDSYGLGLHSDGSTPDTGYPVLIKNILGLTENTNFFHLSKDGAGFVNTPTFISSLQELANGMPSSVDKDTITDVVVCGGWNDTLHIGSRPYGGGILNAVNAFVAEANRIFKNATVHIGMISYCTSPAQNLRSRAVALLIVGYQYNMGKNASIIKGANNMLACSTGMMEATGNNNHPTAKGQDALATVIVSHLLGGDVYYGGNFDSNRPSKTFATGVSAAPSGTVNISEIKEEGMYTITISDMNLLINGMTGDPRYGIPLFTLSNNIGHGIGAPYTSQNVTGNVYLSDGTYVPFSGSLGLDGDTVKMYSYTLNRAGNGFVLASEYAGLFFGNVKMSFPIGWS